MRRTAALSPACARSSRPCASSRARKADAFPRQRHTTIAAQRRPCRGPARLRRRCATPRDIENRVSLGEIETPAPRTFTRPSGTRSDSTSRAGCAGKAGNWSDAQRHMLRTEEISRHHRRETLATLWAGRARCLALLERDLGHAEGAHSGRGIRGARAHRRRSPTRSACCAPATTDHRRGRRNASRRRAGSFSARAGITSGSSGRSSTRSYFRDPASVVLGLSAPRHRRNWSVRVPRLRKEEQRGRRSARARRAVALYMNDAAGAGELDAALDELRHADAKTAPRLRAHARPRRPICGGRAYLRVRVPKTLRLYVLSNDRATWSLARVTGASSGDERPRSVRPASPSWTVTRAAMSAEARTAIASIVTTRPRRAPHG